MTRRPSTDGTFPVQAGNRRPRIALYSHDAQGLGHIRRNLALAGALQELDPHPDVLLLTGAPEAAAFARPPHTDVVGLPAMAKNDAGEYTARHLSVDVDALESLRTAVLTATLTTFAPDLLIVDKHPRGFRGELQPALEQLARLGRTRVVLGLRDVLDEADTARRDWQSCRGGAALDAYYDQIWLYGDVTVHDATADLDLSPAAAASVAATGYLAHGRTNPERAAAGHGRPLEQPYVLCVLGGGSDGVAVAQAFVQAPVPDGHVGVLVTGPQMDESAQATLRAAAARRTDLQVHSYLDDLPRWFEHAAAVVAMGGYNTVCEVLASGTPLLVVPRVTPRAEQLVRAAGLAERGAVDVLHPDALHPMRLGLWAESAVRDPRPTATDLDLDGLSRIPGLARALLAVPPRSGGSGAALPHRPRARRRPLLVGRKQDDHVA